ncbi:MAG TPA: hypothetical protein VI703_03450 [Anaerolineales bacterium]|nr:hypothetical protein [Anaerolineales bacterium]
MILPCPSIHSPQAAPFDAFLFGQLLTPHDHYMVSRAALALCSSSNPGSDADPASVGKIETDTLDAAAWMLVVAEKYLMFQPRKPKMRNPFQLLARR